MKRDRWMRQTFTVCNVLAFNGHPEEQREVVRRIVATPEHHEALVASSMAGMADWPDQGLAERNAKAQAALSVVASRICDEVEAESRARDEAEQSAGGAS